MGLKKEKEEKKRKSLMAREDLVDEISEIARRKGTLYDYINETLQEAVRADSLGLSLKAVIDDRWMVEVAKNSGFTPVSERLWFDVVDKAYQRLGRHWMEDLWYETGQWYGRYYGDVKKFNEVMKRVMWELSELDISSEGGNLTVRCISPKFSQSHSQLFSKFLEGALKVLGFELVEGDISKGVINLKFKESKSG